MGGDYSRVWFDPAQDFAGVLMQQGRVQLDSDWNELVAEILRHAQAATLDMVGPSVVRRDSGAFEITRAGGSLSIGPGRMYVDGLLAENHGLDGQGRNPRSDGWAPTRWDPRLAEMRGEPGALPYFNQPYCPRPAPLPQAGTYLVYLDVWQREVTHLEGAPVESAVGVDTTTRLQTVWQVRFLENIDPAVTCATRVEDIPQWIELTLPAGARLTTSMQPANADADPCLLPPTSSYRGLENQFYRIEIHDPGRPNTGATFKWSRDDAAFAARVMTIPSNTTVTVDRLGRDEFLQFAAGQWVEITDDFRELGGQAGEVRRITDVKPDTLTLTLNRALPPGDPNGFPTDAEQKTIPLRHTRIRLWDQQHQILTHSGSVWRDLDAAGSTGLIDVPGSGTVLELENGVLVQFDLSPGDGQFRTGDYWVFVARTSDEQVEKLTAAPPRGIHHHYARLALVTVPDEPRDCRVQWPPEGAGCGDCTACVTADSHNLGIFTVQQAIDRVQPTGGTVCLRAGVYTVDRPLQIVDGASIRLEGEGWRTILVGTAAGSLLRLEESNDVTVERITILAMGSADIGIGAISARDCIGLTIDSCVLLSVAGAESKAHVLNSQPAGTAIALSGIAAWVDIARCMFLAGVGIVGGIADDKINPARVGYLLSAGLTIRDNIMACTQRGVSFEGATLHALETRVTGNSMALSQQAAIVALGAVLLESTMNIVGNSIRPKGQGIVVGSTGARVCDNDIVALESSVGDGIMLTSGELSPLLRKCQVIGNRIIGVQRHGIALRAPAESLMIKQNVIERAGRGGIVMLTEATATHLSIENNQLFRIAPAANGPQESNAAIRIIQATDVAITGNIIEGVSEAGTQTLGRYGLQLAGCTAARIAGNHIVRLGPAGDFLRETIGIDILGPFAATDVLDNTVQRRSDPTDQLGSGRWLALRVRTRTDAAAERLDSGLAVGWWGNSFALFTENMLWPFLRKPMKTEAVAVRGNVLEALQSSGSTVFVTGPDTCIFSDNRCLLTGGIELPGTLFVIGQPVVQVKEANVIASNNRLRAPKNRVAMTIDQGQSTILGNITSGKILLNGQPLDEPWQSLNVVAP